MDHAMAHGMNVCDTLYLVDAGICRDGPTKNNLHCGTCVSDRLSETLRRFTFSSECHDARAADAFNQPVGQTLVGVLLDSLEVSSDQLKLDRRAAAIKDQYIHDSVRPLPVSDFRHVFSVLGNITLVLETFFAHLL